MRFSLLLAATALSASLAGAQQRADAPAASGTPAVAELPRATVATTYPSGGRAVRVGARDDLQSAIDAARPGDVLLLPAGATYVGNFVLRNRGTKNGSASADAWIVIRTDVGDAALGAEGTRMTPTRAAALRLARILSPNNDAAIGTAAAAHHFRLTGVEVGATSAATQMNMIVRLGDAGDAQRTLASVPHHLVVDRSYVHGNTRLDLKRCVALNSATTAIVDSWLGECHSNNGDSQAILGYNGPGPFKIQNDHLEAGHEVVMFGGGDPSITGLTPSDIEVRGNHFFRPIAWRGVWQVKNLFETKNARRVLIEGNVMENNWADAQVGFAVVLKSENQDGTAPWTTSSDITVRNNIIRHTGNAFNFAGLVSTTNRAVPAARFHITNNVVEGMNVGPYTGDGIAFQLINGLSDAIITHNTILNQNAPKSTVVFDGTPAQRLAMHSNVFFHGVYGVHGSDEASGKGPLARYAPGAVFSRNAIVGGPCGAYPSGTVCPASLPSLGFAAAIRGDYRAAEGPLKGRGLDGGDIGADIDAVERATRGAVVAP